MPNIPFGLGNGTPLLNAGQSGATSLMDALRSGIETYQKNEEAKDTPKRLSEALLGQQITNKMNQQKADYEPMRQQLEERYKNALINKANRGPATVYSNLEKAMQGYERIKQQYGENSPEAQQAKAYTQRLAEGSKGISVTIDPDTGQPLIQIGGASGKGGGGSFINPQTGQTFSQPTSAVTTKLENRIIGEEQIKPVLEDVIKTVPQFQSGWKQLGTSIEGGLNKWVGANYSAPSEKAFGKAQLSKAAESLLNLYGLNANAKNLQEVKSIITPAVGESAQGYKNRIMTEMENFAKSKGRTKEQLRSGLQTTPDSSHTNRQATKSAAHNKTKANDPLGIR